MVCVCVYKSICENVCVANFTMRICSYNFGRVWLIAISEPLLLILLILLHVDITNSRKPSACNKTKARIGRGWWWCCILMLSSEL